MALRQLAGRGECHHSAHNRIMAALKLALGLLPPGAGIALDLYLAGITGEGHAPDLLTLGAFGLGIANRGGDKVRVQARLLDQIGMLTTSSLVHCSARRRRSGPERCTKQPSVAKLPDDGELQPCECPKSFCSDRGAAPWLIQACRCVAADIP